MTGRLSCAIDHNVHAASMQSTEETDGARKARDTVSAQ